MGKQEIADRVNEQMNNMTQEDFDLLMGIPLKVLVEKVAKQMNVSTAELIPALEEKGIKVKEFLD